MHPIGESDTQRLGQVAAFLKRAGIRVRFVDYRRAEDDCLRLAGELRREIGEDALAEATFRAIPRGGLIVLGMLSYALAPRRDQVDGGGGGSSSGPLILVDDCALSGLRLRQELARLGTSRRSVVVAHLYSAPELRQAVMEAEPRVTACIAAGDLADRSREVFADPDEHADWLRRWQDRLGASRYWLGLPELIAFAWGEPDRPFWNAETGRVEDGWRLVAPHRCFKARARLAAGDRPPSGGPWRLPDGVAWGEFDGVLWLHRGTDDEVLSLAGTAAVAWKALVSGGDAGDAAAALAADFQVDPAVARADAESLAAALVEAGLLERADG